MMYDLTDDITIAHELPRRIRLKSRVLKRPSLDPDYFEAVIEAIPGVESVRINFEAGCVAVKHDGKAGTRDAVINSLRNLPKNVFNGNNTRRTPAGLLSVSTKGMLAASTFFLPPILGGAVALFLAAPVIWEGLECLWRRKIKVEVLDAAAVGFSLFRRDYFTASMIVFLLSVGEYFEQLSETKTTGLLKSLLKPQTDRIWIEKDGQEIEIGLEEARIGDRVVSGPGEMIPLDGTVLEGDALVNQSSVTGESLPVHVSQGSQVISGTVIEEGRVVFEATHVGAETSVARISSFLENSLRYESDSQKKSDDLADRLVPITFGLGLGIYGVTLDPAKAAAVLTVDYSCVIKLSSPVAVRVAMYTAAKSGVLMKGAQAMDGIARVETLVFDKTGTLTKGRLEVTDICPANGMDAERLLSFTAAAEAHYSHPVADAVVQAAREKGLDFASTSQVDFIVAHGVSAYIDGKNLMAGSRHFIEDDEDIDCSLLDEKADHLQRQGKSLLYVAFDEQLIGIIGLRDELRPEAVVVLKTLKETGIRKIVILTGDSKVTADAMAAKLPDVDQVYSELKPEDKADIVKTLKKEGQTAFIGDGVNDAPALVSADVGICLPSGADLAKESAQVILLREDLRCLLTARLIALRCQETIHESFVSAVGLNSGFLLLATFGLIAPVTAAILHNVSTVGILGYAGLKEAKRVEESRMSYVKHILEKRTLKREND